MTYTFVEIVNVDPFITSNTEPGNIFTGEVKDKLQSIKRICMLLMIGKSKASELTVTNDIDIFNAPNLELPTKSTTMWSVVGSYRFTTSEVLEFSVTKNNAVWFP